jgi:hypothetical protein
MLQAEQYLTVDGEYMLVIGASRVPSNLEKARLDLRKSGLDGTREGA